MYYHKAFFHNSLCNVFSSEEMFLVASRAANLTDLPKLRNWATEDRNLFS
jgi:hypothetical protein